MHLDPNNLLYPASLAGALLQVKNLEEALTMLALYPDRTEGLKHLDAAILSLGDFDTAEKLLLKAISLNPSI
ncbi:hypothetical protein PARA125_001583 [Parachlamydia sp. AcF125]|nr:hypothetical protein [Parachlamydia sp. AcF125]